MAEHTPGPWKLETVRTSCGICHKIGDFERLGMTRNATYGCVYDDCPAGVQSETIHANAKLMAAAPDLLDALSELHALVWGECPSLLNEDSGGDALLDAKIRDLIA